MSHFNITVTEHITLRLRRSKRDPHVLFGRWIVFGKPQKGMTHGYMGDWAKAIQAARSIP